MKVAEPIARRPHSIHMKLAFLPMSFGPDACANRQGPSQERARDPHRRASPLRLLASAPRSRRAMAPDSRQRRAITAQLASVKQRLEGLRRRAAGRPAEASPARGRCPVTLLLAEMVFHLSQGDISAATDFLMMARRNKKNLELDKLPAMAATWASRTPLEVQHLLETAPGAQERRRRAEERRLQKWVSKQNVQKGLAPSSGSILQEATALRHLPVGPYDGAASDAAQKRQRAREKKWFWRWSRRFRLGDWRTPRARKIPASGLIFGPESGAAQRPRNRGQILRWQQERGRILAPVPGPKNPPPGPQNRGPRARQARASWQWMNLLESLCPADQRIVHINMDETSLRVALDGDMGYVRRPADMPPAVFRSLQYIAPLGQRRTVFSYLAVVCDDEEVQGILPQVIIGNERSLSLRDHTALSVGLTGSPLQLWRRKSAWCNADAIADWVSLLGKTLAPFRLSRYFILSVDACPTHLTETVARACARANVRLHWLPAGLTGTMQPLDTHVFAAYKRRGRQLLETARLQKEDGAMDTKTALQCWLQCTREIIMSRPWRAAFHSCGLGDRQAFLGRRCRSRLALPSEWAPPPAALPSLEQFQAVAGRRRKFPLGWLFSLSTSRGARPGATASATAGAVKRSARADEAHGAHEPWSRRLRSHSARQLPESSPPPSPCPAPPPPMPPPSSRPVARRLWGLPHRVPRPQPPER